MLTVAQLVTKCLEFHNWFTEAGHQTSVVSLVVSNVSEEYAASAVRKRQISFSTENFKTLPTVNDLSLSQQQDKLWNGEGARDDLTCHYHSHVTIHHSGK
jgi:hypothetical protein